MSKQDLDSNFNLLILNLAAFHKLILLNHATYYNSAQTEDTSQLNSP